MRRGQRPWSQLTRATLLLAIFGFGSTVTVAQPAPAQKKSSSAPVTQASKDPEAVRSELVELLQLSPKLTAAVGADPSLLADEAYVSRNNPELAEFLRNHPEVVRNPEFYLFLPPAVLGVGGRPIRGFQGFGSSANGGWDARDIVLFLVFVLILVALVWIFRLVLENVKWNRFSKMQNDLYSKLLDKCGTNEELLASFRIGSGKQVVDLSAIEPPTTSPLTRVFLPLQFGIVLTLAGGGFLALRPSLASTEHDARIFLGLGTLALTLGLGLMISAAASYLLARHLGLLPKPGANEPSENTSASASSSN